MATKISPLRGFSKYMKRECRCGENIWNADDADALQRGLTRIFLRYRLFEAFKYMKRKCRFGKNIWNADDADASQRGSTRCLVLK